MGVTYTAASSKWIGLIIFGILYLDLYQKIDAAFSCSSTNTSDCTCVTVTGPQSKTVLSSTTTSLQCIVTSTTGDEVQWVKGTTPLGIEPTIPGEPRYSMAENYSLIINDVQLSDDSTYFCQVVDCLKPSNTAQLTVYALPSNPEVTGASADGWMDVVANDITSLICSTSHAKPSATIGWFNFSDGNQISSTEDQTLDPDGQTYSYTSTFTFTPSINDNGLVLFCSVGGPAVLLTNQASLDTIITINVISKPSAFTLSDGTPSGGTLTIDYGSAANVTCSATIRSTESDSTLTWERNGVQQTSTWYNQENLNDDIVFSSSLNIVGATENDGATYRCMVTIPGKSSYSYQESLSFTVSIYEFPLGWVIAGSILGFVLILILFIILFICCMRRKDKETTLSDAMPDPSPQQTITANPATDIEEDEPVVERVDATTENALQQEPAEFDTSSDADTDYTAIEREMDEDIHESSNLPDGDVFSLSSSMIRSDRGSPVPNDGDIEDNETSSSDDETDYIPPVPPRTIQTFYV